MLGSCPDRGTAVLKRSVRVAAFVALYVAGAALSTSFVGGPTQVTLIWPSSALSLAFLLLFGMRWWFTTPLAVLIAHLTVAPVPLGFLPFSIVANTLGAVLAAGLVRAYAPGAAMRLRAASGFQLLAAAALGSAASAPVGVGGMVAADMLPASAFFAGTAKWALADLFGVVALTPALLLAGHWRRMTELRGLLLGYGGLRERTAWLLVLVLSMAFFLAAGGRSGAYALGLSSLPIAALLWAAVRFEPLYAAAATGAFALVATTAIGHGLGGFSPPDGLGETIILIAFMSLVSIMPQMLSGVAHENRIAAQRLIERANTDAATGLANRTAFEAAARAAIACAPGERMALAYVDLDQFKVVNDTLSHAAGDRMIRALASVLRTLVEGDDLLARTGGDEFALLLRRADIDEAERRALALRTAIGAYRFADGDHVIAQTASIGLVPFTAGSLDFSALLAQADAACFTAKARGGDRVQVATGSGGEVLAHTEAMRWATVVSRALDEDRFVLFVQSLAPLRGAGAGAHVEVQLRQRDAGGALLLPGAFVPAAERFGLGERLDRHVVGRVLDWFDEHPAQVPRVAQVAVNLTAASVQSEAFADFLGWRLERSRLRPAQLCLEITETSAVLDLARARQFIDRMRGLGCAIALDDFGTGFSSFAYLQTRHADYIKVDASFVREVGSSAAALAIVRAIAEIAHVMERRTVAEGVETDAVRERLVALGVDYAQGFAIHRPEPLAEWFARGA
jgi:diguanylate cyclase (GGDEF)-like protein